MTRLALVGCGGMARSHRDRFGPLADRMRVAATVDLDFDRARLFAESLGADVATDRLEEALPLCDAVLLAIPHHLHHPIGMACLRAGKHVLIEKPLANSESECTELIQEAERRALTLMVGYCMRYHPLTLALKGAMDSGACGEVFHVSIWTEQLTELPPDHWAARAETVGGGQLFSHGCHYVDLMLYLLGEPVSGVHVGTNAGTSWMEREGTSDLMLKFESGAVGYHGATWGARGTRLGYAVHVQGTDGMLEADFHRGRLAHIRGAEETMLLQTESQSKHLELEMAHFLDCVESGARPFTDGPDSLQGLRVIWRLYQAEESGRVADLRGLSLRRSGADQR